MNYLNITNTRALTVKFLEPTNNLGSRIKITDNYNADKKESVVFGYCYRTDNVLEQATDLLLSKGFDIVARSSMPDYYVLCIENWGENFKSIKELKK